MCIEVGVHMCINTHTDAHSVKCVFKEYLVTEIKFLLVTFLAGQTDLICQVGFNLFERPHPVKSEPCSKG